MVRCLIQTLRATLFGAVLLGSSTAGAAEIWREAETPDFGNWDDIMSIAQADGSGASGNRVLRVYTRRAPENGTYRTGYHFDVPEDGEYNLFLAMTPPSAGWASPVRMQLDDQSAIDLSPLNWITPSYGGPPPTNYLGWLNPGKLKLSRGRHTLTFLVDTPRKADGQYICFFDGFWLTTDDTAKPAGNYYVSKLQTPWPEMLKKYGSMANLKKTLIREEFDLKLKMRSPHENITPANAAMVREKIMARPLPEKSAPKTIHRIGVHGMEQPFVTVRRRATFDPIFELLARAGVDSLRTAESCWHRLGGGEPAHFNFAELDYQVEMANRYGMNFLFTIGYPPARYNVTNHILSTFKPEYEPLFRDYLKTVITRYGSSAQYWEYGNEVDAPDTWWRGAAPADYVRDCKIVREELAKAGNSAPLLGISATYSRDTTRDNMGGRVFSRKLAELGIGDVLDGYTLHYTWALSQQDFVRFFRELTPEAPAAKRLINSEEAGYAHPADVIKLMARDLYLYGFESVYYYLACDWIEVGTAIYSGLFDLDWQPKLRLLSLAAAADAMKTRLLAGLAEPAPGIEAYLLRAPGDGGDAAVVLWQNGGNEEIGSRFTPAPPRAPIPVEFPADSVVKAVDWKLDEPQFTPARPVFEIGAEPLIVYVKNLPAWKQIPPAEWLAAHTDVKSSSKAMLPGQN